jgi:hypothetical protein
VNAVLKVPQQPQRPVRTGDVVAWIVIDPGTGELVMRCKARSDARDMAHAVGARYAKVVVSK